MRKWWKNRPGWTTGISSAITVLMGAFWAGERWIGLAGLPDDAETWQRRIDKALAVIPSEVYLVAITAGLTTTVIFGAIWLTERFDKGPVLQALSDCLMATARKDYGERIPAREIPEARFIRHKLDALDIPHPDLNQRWFVWTDFLNRLAGEARAGALEEARCVWEGMRAEARRELEKRRATSPNRNL